MARKPALAPRVSITVRHESLAGPCRRVPATARFQLAGAHHGRIVCIVGGHRLAAAGDASIETLADGVLLAVMALLEPTANEGEGEEAEEEDDDHDDPFLHIRQLEMSSSRSGEGVRTQWQSHQLAHG